MDELSSQIPDRSLFSARAEKKDKNRIGTHRAASLIFIEYPFFIVATPLVFHNAQAPAGGRLWAISDKAMMLSSLLRRGEDKFWQRGVKKSRKIVVGEDKEIIFEREKGEEIEIVKTNRIDSFDAAGSAGCRDKFKANFIGLWVKIMVATKLFTG